METAAAHSRIAVRALDNGRLSLPLHTATGVKLAAEQDGCVLTVLLPGSSQTERRCHRTAELPLTSGRLTLPQAVRSALGIPDRGDVLVAFDDQTQTLTLTAASRIGAVVLATLAGLRGIRHEDQTASDVEQLNLDAGPPLRIVPSPITNWR